MPWTVTQYKEGAYAGMYYLEMGNAPQSYAGTTSTINATATGEYWVDDNEYYVNTANPNIKYVKNGDNYYLVEPVRWIIIADENYPTDGGSLGIDYLSNVNLATIDRTELEKNPLRQIVVVSERLLANFSFTADFSNYTSQMTNLRDKIFKTSEKQQLNTVSLTTGRISKLIKIVSDFFLLAGSLWYSPSEESMYTSTYLTSSTLRSAYQTAYQAGTSINPSSSYEYWSRSSHWTGSINYRCYYVGTNGALQYQDGSKSNTVLGPRGVRPAFVINLDI